MMVGDTIEDYAAAREAGMRFAFAEYGYGHLAGDADCLRIAELTNILGICGFPHGVSFAEFDRRERG
jgi:phosphoglycolate phosphatase-like HAD superfamily hydrolase